MTTRYDIDHLSEAQFEQGSRGRVLRNILGIRSKRAMDEIEASKLVETTDWAIRHVTADQRRRYLSVAHAMAGRGVSVGGRI